MEHRHIVIVGGGYGGAYLAYKLVSEKIGKVSLIDPKDYSFHCIGALRTAVDPSYGKKLFISFSDFLSTAHVKAKAIKLDAKNKRVFLDNQNEICYSDIIIATGSSSSFPGKLGYCNSGLSEKEMLEKYKDFQQEIRRARNVVVVGGGAVGVEFSGEVKTDFPQKQVILISSNENLVTDRGLPMFQSTLKEVLEEKKIEVYYGERVLNLKELETNTFVESQIVKTNKREIECDMVVPCIGTKINNEFFKDELTEAMNDAGTLCVNKFLQVEGYDNLYAIGDINNVEEEKMAKAAFCQADALLETLKGNATVYKPDASLSMLVPVGRDHGVGQTQNGVIKGEFVKKYKSEDLFAGKIWENFGLKPPQNEEKN